MNLQDISSFRAIMEHRSLQRAAALLGLSQPALTKCVHRLEKELRAKLFERGPTGMEPTPAALAFAAHAARLEGEYNAALGAVSDLTSNTVATLRVGVTPLWEHLVNEAYLALLASRPAMRLQLTQTFSDKLIETLTLGLIDFAIITNPLPASETFDVLTLAHDKLRVVARRDHPLLRQPKPLQLSDLTRHHWIAPRRGVWSREQIDARFIQAGLPPPQVQVEVDGGTIPSTFPLVARSDLLAVCLNSLLPEATAAGLLPAPLPELAWPMSPSLVIRRNPPRTPLAEDFIQQLRLNAQTT